MPITPRPRLADPATPAEWLGVAKLRLADARHLSTDSCYSVGSIYLAGYAVECALKAQIRQTNARMRFHGGDGHNLRSLWAMCDLVLRDLQDPTGSKNYFMTDWSTDLRYQATLNSEIAISDLVAGAGRILARIATQARRQIRHSKGR